MLNVIKMDIYRMIKSRNTWIIIMIAASFTVFIVWAAHYESKLREQSEQSVTTDTESVDEDDSGWGVSIESDSSWSTEGVSVAELYSTVIQSGIILIFITIFCVIYINDERKTGFIKNIAGQVSNRGFLVISKLCSILLFSLMLFIASLLAIMLGVVIFFGNLDMNGMGDYLFFFAMQLLLHMGFGAFITCLVVVTKSTVVSIVIGILTIFGTLSTLLSFVDNILHSLGISESFSLLTYTVTSNISSITFDGSSGDYLRAFIVAVVFIVATVAISMVTMQKQDVQ